MTIWKLGLFLLKKTPTFCKAIILLYIMSQAHKVIHTSKGGGHFQSKNLCCRSWNWYKIVSSGFRVCFFQQLYSAKSKQDTLWGRHGKVPLKLSKLHYESSTLMLCKELSSSIFQSLWVGESVRHAWHPSRSPLCAIYKGMDALYWPSITKDTINCQGQ